MLVIYVVNTCRKEIYVVETRIKRNFCNNAKIFTPNLKAVQKSVNALNLKKKTLKSRKVGINLKLFCNKINK